jgi:hypothetical protein
VPQPSMEPAVHPGPHTRTCCLAASTCACDSSTRNCTVSSCSRSPATSAAACCLLLLAACSCLRSESFSARASDSCFLASDACSAFEAARQPRAVRPERWRLRLEVHAVAPPADQHMNTSIPQP